MKDRPRKFRIFLQHMVVYILISKWDRKHAINRKIMNKLRRLFLDLTISVKYYLKVLHWIFSAFFSFIVKSADLKGSVIVANNVTIIANIVVFSAVKETLFSNSNEVEKIHSCSYFHIFLKFKLTIYFNAN